jgi:general secretion pathway protein K
MVHERGFALVLVLWSLLLLTTIGISFGYAARVETLTGTTLSESVRAEAVAAAGVRRAILGLLAEEKERRWPIDGQPRAIPWPNALLLASVRSESAKIDLNQAPPELLTRLFENRLPEGEAERLVTVVLAQRERLAGPAEQASDPRSSRSARSAKRAQTQRTGAGPGPQAFSSVDELVQLPGFDPERVRRVRPFLTVHSGQAQVDAASADEEVLAAVPGVSREAARQFVEERAARSTPDGEPLDLSSLGEGATYLEASSRSRVANVRAVARLNAGGAALVEAVVQLGGSESFQLLDWRETWVALENPLQ